MATASQLTPSAKTSKTPRSLGLVCPLCGGQESISVDLNDLRAITCESCSESFSAAQAVAKLTEQLERWRAVGAWLELAPV